MKNGEEVYMIMEQLKALQKSSNGEGVKTEEYYETIQVIKIYLK